MFAGADRRLAVRCVGRVLLVPAAALGVHQLRFMLAFGGGAGAELSRQGHSYLHSLVPWIVLLVGLGAGAFLFALARALGGQRSVPRHALSFGALWLVCSLCLVAIFVTQEFLEGLFAAGHPAGLAGIFGYGGWWSIPAAACVGLALAAVFEGASWVLREVADRHRGRPQPATRPDSCWPRISSIDTLRPRPLASCAAGRAPPAAS
jgi:hypothetical protein